MTGVIGLTGGIASGKSTVAAILRKQGIKVVDADQISREVVEVGKPVYKKIIEVFGIGILNDDKSINRGKLGSIIFSDETKRQELNSIVHPAVRKEMIFQIEEARKKKLNTVVLDIPLLFESNLTHMVQKTILVYVDEQTQLQRLMARNQYSEEEAIMRIQSQMPLKEKVKLSDYVIDNNGPIESTEQQVLELIQTLNQ